MDQDPWKFLIEWFLIGMLFAIPYFWLGEVFGTADEEGFALTAWMLGLFTAILFRKAVRDAGGLLELLMNLTEWLFKLLAKLTRWLIFLIGLVLVFAARILTRIVVIVTNGLESLTCFWQTKEQDKRIDAFVRLLFRVNFPAVSRIITRQIWR